MTMTPVSEIEQFENIPVEVFAAAEDGGRRVAAEIARLIRDRRGEGKNAVLGLATGSTPVGLYRELIRLHREEGLSFANVITFNLDEYYGLGPDHRESYHRFMREQLFDHIDLPESQIHVPDGRVERSRVFAWCREFEEKIRKAGGIDIQVLGIGRTGHIGFNEPGSGKDSRTRLVTLDTLTRRDAARDFLGEDNVPRFAITMGVGTILEARQVLLLAWGSSKAEVVARAVEGKPVESLPASFLQLHPRTRFIVDEAAASELTRFKHPWLVGQVDWMPEITRKAVVWLASKTNKSVLKLVDEDYSENGLADLLTTQGPAYDLNIRIFNELQHTITGWPGGKPNADDTHRPERASPNPKRVLVLSPEPQDDVLGLGGTLHRLIDQGHSVAVAYFTSGNLAVPDEDALRATQFIADLDAAMASSGAPAADFARAVSEQIEQKDAYEADAPEVRRLKGLIRRGEARSAVKSCGLPADRIRFLDLPFYEEGRYRQFHPEDDDVSRVAGLLAEIRPHQVFVTGAQSDPNSLPAVCFAIFRQAWEQQQNDPWRRDCYVWIYRSGDEEWPVESIDMAVPLSPRELAGKIQSIYQHQTQRSQTPVSGLGPREVWQQAEQRNRRTAEIYDQLGLADYEAIEAFRRWESRE